MRAFGGVWPALVTPFTRADAVNVPVLKALVEHLIGKGVHGFYICGSTGEGLVMRVEERQAVAEAVLEQARGHVPVIVHVGATATRDSAILARHAGQIGAAGVSSILPPVYAGEPGSIMAHFAAIAAAAPDLPLLPYVLGGHTDAVSLLRELSAIPNVAGCKYTGPNMFELGQIVRLRQGEWTIFSGMDEQSVCGAMFGASGCIGSSLNYMPGVYREIYQSYRAGDLQRAQGLQIRANEVMAVADSFGVQAGTKGTLHLLGFDCGQPRLPQMPLAEDKRPVLKAQLEAVAFSELANL